jgi:hypothetical protein
MLCLKHYQSTTQLQIGHIEKEKVKKSEAY